MAKEEYKLTVREQRFADEYISNGRNATQAYKRIQPNSSDGNARARGAEWRAKRIVVQLSKRQSKYCRWVEQENKKPLDVKDDAKMMVSVLINIVYLYLTADLEKDKARAANVILKLKRNYLREVANLKVIDVQELLTYGK